MVVVEISRFAGAVAAGCAAHAGIAPMHRCHRGVKYGLGDQVGFKLGTISRRWALAHCGGFGTFGLAADTTRNPGSCRTNAMLQRPGVQLEQHVSRFRHGRPTQMPQAAGRFCFYSSLCPLLHGGTRPLPARTRQHRQSRGLAAGNSDKKLKFKPNLIFCASHFFLIIYKFLRFITLDIVPTFGKSLFSG